MVHHIGKAMQKQLLHIQLLQYRQLRAGDLGILIVFIQISACVYQVIHRGTDVRIVDQTVHGVGRAVKAVAAAIRLFCHI